MDEGFSSNKREGGSEVGNILEGGGECGVVMWLAWEEEEGLFKYDTEVVDLGGGGINGE